MATLRSNLVKRVDRLPKPTNAAGALQPLFEAVSNAIHSTQAKFNDRVGSDGRVNITVSTSRKKDNVWATVEDNGLGLTNENWDAFTTTDTDNKVRIGGKGVGRLLWLDCFQKIEIRSTFLFEGSLKSRQFEFNLANEEQIKNLKEGLAPEHSKTSFFVRFSGLRDNAYQDKFPGRSSFIFQHIASHFLPTFIGDSCPKITVHVGDETREYPTAIDAIVQRSETLPLEPGSKYNSLQFTLMECDKISSSDLQGSHFIHFIAHDRTVRSQCIDAKLGLKYFGAKDDQVFHGILTGDFLDQNVNQERTAFNFEESTISDIINEILFPHIEVFLEAPLSILRGEQLGTIEQITATYPSVAFGTNEELQQRVPTGELNADAIYGHLARERFRRDERQAEKIRNVLTRLKEGAANINTFMAAIADAGKAIEDAEQRSLTEYIIRRKVVLDFIEILLDKVRDDSRDGSYQREDILHSFICPMRVNSIDGSGRRVEAVASHDLWIIDERLAFAQYFSSDVDFNTLAESIDSGDRPDVLIFDYVHGLRQTDEPSKVLLIEFKRPGRKSYLDNENPQHQIERYVRRLQSGSLEDVRGRPIKLDKATIFHCFIVADIVGKLDEWTFSWQRTADGHGRIYRPNDGFRGSIELIGWDHLLGDARARNQAFFDRAGISGKSLFSAD